MPVVCLKYKRKPWVVKYREPWSGRPRQRAFAVEAEARAFEDVQASLYERERAIIKAVRPPRRMCGGSSPWAWPPARVSAPVSFFGSAGRISTRVEPRCACPMPPREHGPRPARCRYGRMFCACCGAGKRKTRPWAVHGSSTTEDAPCAVSAELGIIPCAGRVLSDASGPMTCATLSPAGLWIMMRTLNAWPRSWGTAMKK